ncbi:MAG: hypothetical protein ABI203_01905 [Mucilaginibacter sp.]
MSRKIWTADRLFPTAPAFEFLDHVPAAIHMALFLISLLFISLVFVRNNKFFLMGLMVVEILSCLLDQNRWLPWEYLYLFILFIYLTNTVTPKQIVACIIFLLVSTYFYSGLCKLNEGFVQIVWINMVLRGFFKLPAYFYNNPWVHYAGYLSGIVELLSGIGLLFKKTQRISAWILITTHLFILILLGPLGFRGYQVLWPWNIAMILFLYIIFLKKGETAIAFPAIFTKWNMLVFICWGILPALSFFGYWDKNLSSNLFSANLPGMIICVKDTSACKPLQRFCYKKDNLNLCNGEAKIDIQSWVRAETNVAAYPEVRVFRIIQAKLEKQYPAAGLSFVYLNNDAKK